MRNVVAPVAIDVFSGVGGMSLGFEQAGFKVVAGFDVEQRNVDTYELNFGANSAFQIDLGRASSNVLLKLAKVRRGQVDVVFGGPPCQGFSAGGTRNQNDPRNQLLGHFARIVRGVRPKYFVLENVDGLLHSHSRSVLDSFLKRVDQSGYSVVAPIAVLDATAYGVPQRRRRTFILGYLNSVTPLHYPAPVELIDGNGRQYVPTVGDAISDLPEVSDYPILTDQDHLPKSELGTASHYAQILRGEIRDPGDRSRFRHRKGRRLTGCLLTTHSAEVVRRFRRTDPGSREPISRYFRLSEKSQAPTLRAGTDVEHGKHTAPRPIHPEVPRCITTREAARLHSYPDWFQFHDTRWHAFRQIGNSVPPRMARAVAEVVMGSLGK